MSKSNLVVIFLSMLLFLSACKKENTEFVRISSSLGDTVALQGLSGTEVRNSTISGSQPGDNAMRSVFVDLSKDVQTQVLRSSWDLGFACNNENFTVILNHSRGATAAQLDKIDITTVGEADTSALLAGKTLELGNSFTNIDPVDGIFTNYLAGTVFKQISATTADNRVFIVNRGLSGLLKADGTPIQPIWEKVQVTRNTTGNGYIVKYGRIGLAVTTLEVFKDPAFNFQYISFIGGRVAVEPAKALWDIQWTYSTYKTSATTPVAVAVPDFVLINFAGGVTASEIKYTSAAEAERAYAGFSASNLEGLAYSAERDVIGTNWRTISTTGTTSTVNRDRLYAIKDAKNNIYILRFNSFTSADGGTRGLPVIAYKRIQEGAED